MYTIYKHTLQLQCEHFGYSYIGQTSKSPEKRWKNGNGYPKCSQPVFYNAIQKYGWDNFKHEILEVVRTLEEANEREQYWIAYYHTWIYDPDCRGYNNTQGGDGNLGHLHTEETKQKLSLAHRGKGHPMPEHQRVLLSKLFKGRKLSQEQIKKIADAKRGYKKSEESIEKHRKKMFKKVICLETNIVYTSMKAAAEAIGCSPAAISSCVRGVRNSVFGYHFKYWKELTYENNNI